MKQNELNNFAEDLMECVSVTVESKELTKMFRAAIKDNLSISKEEKKKIEEAYNVLTQLLSDLSELEGFEKAELQEYQKHINFLVEKAGLRK